MENEHTNYFPNNCQYTISSTNNQTNDFFSQNQCKIYEMDSGYDKDKQAILPGHSNNLVSIPPTNKPHIEKLDRDLDMIDISDSENEDVNFNKAEIKKEEYDNYVNKINNYYIEDDDEINGYIPSKNEMMDIEEEPQKQVLNEKSYLKEVGGIFSIADGNILIQGVNNNEIINLNTCVFSKNKECVGFICDIIGNIDEPYYLLKVFKDVKEVLNINDSIYFDVNTGCLLNKEAILRQNIQGTDASNVFDEEIGNEKQEFSDDEKEQEHKQNLKKQKKGKTTVFPNNNKNYKEEETANSMNPFLFASNQN